MTAGSFSYRPLANTTIARVRVVDEPTEITNMINTPQSRSRLRFALVCVICTLMCVRVRAPSKAPGFVWLKRSQCVSARQCVRRPRNHASEILMLSGRARLYAQYASRFFVFFVLAQKEFHTFVVGFRRSSFVAGSLSSLRCSVCACFCVLFPMKLCVIGSD